MVTGWMGGYEVDAKCDLTLPPNSSACDIPLTYMNIWKQSWQFSQCICVWEISLPKVRLGYVRSD
jgi:hypothetical protein